MAAGVLVALALWAVSSGQTGLALRLVHNGYEDLVVAIGREVPEDDAYPAQIESLMTKFSDFLYIATRKRAYIRSVKVLIPTTWSDKPSYTDPGEVDFEHAQIRIDKAHPLQGNNPYTFQPGQCGEAGLYIHLTPDYVLDSPGIDRDLNWGDTGKLLVHEFAHLRYGVFDEYGVAGDPLNPIAYINDKAKVVPSSCAEDMPGAFTDSKTGGPCSLNTTTNLPDINCDFFPDETDNPAVSSLMYIQFLQNITHFCEANPQDPRLQHNQFARTMHNRKCPGHGTWDVITEHKDFKNDNSARTVSNTKPQFQYVYNRHGYWQDGTERCGRRVVLLLDLSGSMRRNNRWFRQAQTADKFIRDIIPVGSNLGIVKFSNESHVWTPMTPLKNEMVKSVLAKSLPMFKDIGGDTGIGLAMLQALSMLNKTGGTEGGRILLITDGEETETPRLSSLMDHIVASGVKVHTIAYSKTASKSLATLSQRTGGLYGFSSDEVRSTSLDSAIRRLWSDLAVCEQSALIEIQRTSVTMELAQMTYSGSADIDRTVGVDTEFVFTLPRKADVQIRVLSPSGCVFDSSSSNYTHDTTLNIVRVRLQVDLSSTGTWTYTLRQSASILRNVGVTVTSKPRDKKSTFTFRTWTNDVTELDTNFVCACAQRVFPGDPRGRQYISRTARWKRHCRAPQRRWKGNIVPAGSYNSLFGTKSCNSFKEHEPNLVPLFTYELSTALWDPDNVKDDGVYTSWVVSFSSDSQYTMDAHVRNILGRTMIVTKGDITTSRAWSRYKRSPRRKVSEPIDELFTRTHSLGMLDFSLFTPHLQRLPPPRVTDLVAWVTDRVARRVTLSWTAPRHHTETSYDIKVGFNFTSVKALFHEAIRVDESFALPELSPLAAGDTLEVSILIPAFLKQSTIVFGMKIIDGDGLSSELSNLVAVTFEPTSVLKRSITQSSQSASSMSLCLPSLALLAGLLCVMLCGVFVIGVACSRSRKKSKTNLSGVSDLECQL